MSKYDIWENLKDGKSKRVARNLSADGALIISRNLNARAAYWCWYTVEPKKPSFFARLFNTATPTTKEIEG
jgi:hypothetical protein